MNKNLAQSVKDRLKNVARSSNREYNFLRIQYLQERFLARLSKSAYRNEFVLKGALLLVAYRIPVVRPSRDADFMALNQKRKRGYVIDAIRKVCSIELEDGVAFLDESLEADAIGRDVDFNAIRIKVSALVGGDLTRLQIDVGMGDKIVDGPVELVYPTILEFSSPDILAYSLESAMAEKLEAIVSLGTFSSRMKDYFDLWFILNEGEMDLEKYGKSILITFANRNTSIQDCRNVFDSEFKANIRLNRQWEAFLNRSGFSSEQTFESVVDDLEKFLSPILSSISS